MNKRAYKEYQLNNKHLTLPILIYPVAAKLGYSVEEMSKDSDKTVECMKYIVANYPVSLSLCPMDLSVEAEAFGAKIRFSDDEVPTVVGSVIETVNDIDKIKIPHNGTHRTAKAVETIVKAKENLADKYVIASCIGPYSLAGRLVSMTELMVGCYEDPDAVGALINICADYLTRYILNLKSAGADGVVMAEPAAGLLSHEFAAEFSCDYVKKIIDKVNEDFLFIYHNCGYVTKMAGELQNIGADIYHFGNAVDISEMLDLMPSDTIISGNINPVMLTDSDCLSVKTTVSDLLNKCDKYSNFVLSTGCDVPPKAKFGNINAYFDAVKEFYGK
jgi:uroporphyrinogen decarboxylase